MTEWNHSPAGKQAGTNFCAPTFAFLHLHHVHMHTIVLCCECTQYFMFTVQPPHTHTHTHSPLTQLLNLTFGSDLQFSLTDQVGLEDKLI